MNKILLFLLSFCIYNIVLAQSAPPFQAGVSRGKIEYDAINEASGIVESVLYPRHYWVHNDSGDEARIFLVDSNARHRATVLLLDVNARDWEDITIMRRDGKDYIVIADIGDNRGKYPSVNIHLLEEPNFVFGSKAVDTIITADIQSYNFRYEDGPRDAESLFYDPVADQLFIISKRELQVGVYMVPLSGNPSETAVLHKVQTLPYTFVTAAEMSADGTEFLMKNLLEVLYWKRKPGESVVDMLGRPATNLPYFPEPQGEAISFSRDGTGYVTISEQALGLPAHLFFYKRQ